MLLSSGVPLNGDIARGGSGGGLELLKIGFRKGGLCSTEGALTFLT